MFDDHLLSDTNLVIHNSIIDSELLSHLQYIVGSERLGWSPHPAEHEYKDTSYYVSEEFLNLQKLKESERTYRAEQSKCIDLPVTRTGKVGDIVRYIAKADFKKHSILVSGTFLYKKGDFMGWHTNSDSTELRLYVTYVPESNKSFFRYTDHNGEIVTTYDTVGWSYRLFQPSGKLPLWHCVYSDTNRYSVGFKVIPNL